MATKIKKKVKQAIDYKEFSSVITKKIYCGILWNTILLGLYVGWEAFYNVLCAFGNLIIYPLTHRKLYRKFKNTSEHDELFTRLMAKE